MTVKKPLDYVGLNRLIYDPQGDDYGAYGDDNTLGYTSRFDVDILELNFQAIDRDDTFVVTQFNEGVTDSVSVTFEIQDKDYEGDPTTTGAVIIDIANSSTYSATSIARDAAHAGTKDC